MTTPPDRRRPGMIVTRRSIIRTSIPMVVLVATFLFRWVTLDFSNDYFMHVAWAAEMLKGSWPVRDFVEPGFLLQTSLTYAGFQLGGYQLFWEGIVACALIASGSSFAYLTCRRLGIASWLTLIVVVFAVAAYPRLYAYPKAFIYPVALWAIVFHAHHPTRRSLLLLAGVIAMAFLFRHDHGVWVGAAVALSLVLTNWRHPRVAVRSLASCGLVVGVLVLPWVAWVATSGHFTQYVGFLTQQSGGLLSNRILPDRRFDIDSSQPLVTLAPTEFPRVGIRWAPDTAVEDRQQRERLYGLQPLPDTDEYRLVNVDRANVMSLVTDPVVEDTSGIDRGTLRAPAGLFSWAYFQAQRYVPLVRVRVLPGVVRSSNAHSWLTYATFVLPWIVLAVALLMAARGRVDPALAALVVPAAILSIVVYQTLVRGSPDSRLGDVAPITAVLLAWVLWRGWTVGGWTRLVLKPAVIAVLLLMVASSVSYGQAAGRLARAGIDGPDALARRIRDVGARYANRPLDVFAPAGATGLPGVARRLNECMAPDERFSVIGFEPQLFVLSERSFAGGMAFYDLAWASSEEDQMLTIERWSRQRVPIVIAMESEWDSFSRDYPLVRAFIDRSYTIAHRSSFGGGKAVRVHVHTASSPSCFQSYGGEMRDAS